MSETGLALAALMEPARPRYRWAILAAVVAGQIVASAFYLAWAAITPFFRDDFGLTREQVGMVVGATAAGSAVASAPLGRVGDRIGARLTITGGLVALAGLAMLVTLSQSFWLLFASIFAAGLAYGALNPAGIKVLVPWFPRRELGTAVALKQIGYPLGGALAAATLPALTLALGSWRLPVASLGVLIAASAFGTRAVVRERPGGRPQATAAKGRWWSAILRRNVLLLSLVGFLYAALQSAWLGHLVLYAQEGLKLPVMVGAGFLALSQLSAAAGRVLLGLVSDRLCGGRRRGLLAACGLIGGAFCGVLPLVGSPAPWLVGLIVVGFGLSGGSWTALQFTALADEGGERSSGTTVGFGVAFNSTGFMLAPPLFGRAVDTLGTYGPAWQGLAIVGILGALVAAMVRERPAGVGGRG